MAVGHFIWTDLSTFDLPQARRFYSALFDWSFGGADDYDFAVSADQPRAAIFPMPAALVKINMPSFWMSYVEVADLDASVAIARAHDGVIIEIEPQAFDAQTRIALVRDPAGAGFTMVEGPGLRPPTGMIQGEAVQLGDVLRRYHHLPDIAQISGFYGDLFGWRFDKISNSPWPVYDIRHPDGSLVAQAEEVPEDIRGKFRYWMPCFAVPSLGLSQQIVAAQQGEVTVDLADGRLMVADEQGATFMVQADAGAAARPNRPAQTGGGSAGANATGASATGSVPWRAALGLLCIWLAVVFDLPLFWGLLFLMWSWSALRAGRADFIDPVDRHRNPILFWGLSATWIGLSLWMIGQSLLPLLAAH
ncbi:VOC family protein [Phaeobacter sp.]|uniref:VOC family protein n=1 Tax=Phaeobacter sp. TaxID=1902409 RepID=UPI0025DBCEE7|nr:VOC family protein [Phaeobacter sp.]